MTNPDPLGALAEAALSDIRDFASTYSQQERLDLINCIVNSAERAMAQGKPPALALQGLGAIGAIASVDQHGPAGPCQEAGDYIASRLAKLNADVRKAQAG